MTRGPQDSIESVLDIILYFEMTYVWIGADFDWRRGHSWFRIAQFNIVQLWGRGLEMCAR